MKLKELLQDKKIELISGNLDQDVTGIEINSKEVKPGNLFICVKGSKSDGHTYIPDAIEHGASIILVEDVPEDLSLFPDVTFIKSSNTTKAIGELASDFYGNPGKDLTIVGITGTKGKTTTANMIYEIFKENGLKSGFIGTLGITSDGNFVKTPNTTPDALVLQKTLREMVDNGVTHLVMEASSQGFKLFRTEGLKFDIGILLNIDDDHIGEGEHADFNEYLECKKRIFDYSEKVIVNKDDKVWELLSPEQQEESLTFSIDDPETDYHITEVKPYKTDEVLGMDLVLDKEKKEHLKLKIPSLFNVSNTIAALAISTELGLDRDKTFKAIEEYKPYGRTQLIKKALKDHDKVVFIDYAHNRKSFLNLMNGLRIYNPDRILSLFSILEEETFDRRHTNSLAAGENSDYTIFTSGEDGVESFRVVVEDVKKGLEESQGEYEIIEDRKEAIHKILDMATPNDIVLLIGMGDVRTVLVDGEKKEFNEEKIVLDYLNQ